MDSHYDVIIIGAGLQGLATARIFLQLDPGLNIVILDSNETIGGVWSKEKLYSGLKANNLRGTFEYTDFPMNDEFGVKEGEHIPGESIHAYFRQYSEKHDLTRRIQFQTKVTVAEKTQEGWKLELENLIVQGRNAGNGRVQSPPSSQQTVTCAKLVIAMGLTSVPKPIDIHGSEDFKAPIINFGNYATEAAKIYEDPAVKNVTVIGGAKAAHDIVYLMATHGKQVNWIIRASGHGPTYMAPAHVYVGPFRCWLEKITTTRIFTFFSPCVWGDADGFGYLRNLLHNTSIGRKLVDAFWWKLGSDFIDQTHIAKHPETKKLQPDQPAFWYGASLGILNYPTNIYEFVKSGQIKVLRKDVKCLESPKTVRFEDRSEVQSDALICSMGWKFEPSIEFRPKEIHADLGIPSSDYSKSQKELWDKLDALADLELFTRFPKLATGPRVDHDYLVVPQSLPNSALADMTAPRREFTPWRLWRGIAPPALPTRDIVFLGLVYHFNGAVRSETSSIWAYAYFYNKLNGPLTSVSHPPKQLRLEDRVPAEQQFAALEKGGEVNPIMYDTALFNRYGKRRTPYGFGFRNPDLVFEAIPYLDLLVGDIGLSAWRKGWGWVGELFGGCYDQKEYRGLAEEWRAKVGKV